MAASSASAARFFCFLFACLSKILTTPPPCLGKGLELIHRLTVAHDLFVSSRKILQLVFFDRPPLCCLGTRRQCLLRQCECLVCICSLKALVVMQVLLMACTHNLLQLMAGQRGNLHPFTAVRYCVVKIVKNKLLLSTVNLFHL